MDSQKPTVVVIGAGMAGLSAAAQLADSGLFDITVLEAMDRPGGRIHSTWEMGNTVLELGANWIHGTEGNPVYELAAKNNLLEEDSSSESSSSSCESSSEDSIAEWFQSNDGEDIFFTEDGTQVSKETAKGAVCFYSSLVEEIQRLTATSEGAKYKSDSTGEFLERLLHQKLSGLNLEDPVKQIYQQIFHWCMRQECVDNGCQSMKDFCVQRFNDYKALPGDYYCTLGDKGYQGVLDVLLKKLSTECVKYNAAVTKIEWSSSSDSDNDQSQSHASSAESDQLRDPTTSMCIRNKPVVIKCENGDQFNADHVIVTASVGYLKRHHSHLFFPALPDDKQRTLEVLQFGTINKIFLRYKKPFWKKMFKKVDLDGMQLLWEEDYANADLNQVTVVTSEEEIERHFLKKLTGFDTVEKHSNMLVGWISGKEAEFMETLEDEKIGQVCTKVLRQFLNNPRIPEPAEVLCTRWHSNPYICGAYGAFLTPESSGNEYDIMLEPVYGPKDFETKEEKSPLLFFAGEAYHKGYQSTTHGAMATGYSQADKLIKMYTNQKDV